MFYCFFLIVSSIGVLSLKFRLQLRVTVKRCPTLCKRLLMPSNKLETRESAILYCSMSVECVLSVMYGFQQVQYMEIFLCVCTSSIPHVYLHCSSLKRRAVYESVLLECFESSSIFIQRLSHKILIYAYIMRRRHSKGDMHTVIVRSHFLCFYLSVFG